MVAGGALETGQVGSYCQPQLISDRDNRIAGGRGQFGEVRHDLTLGLPAGAAKPANLHQARQMRMLVVSMLRCGHDVEVAPKWLAGGRPLRAQGVSYGLLGPICAQSDAQPDVLPDPVHHGVMRPVRGHGSPADR